MPRFISSMVRPVRALAPRFTTWISRLALAVLAIAIVGGGSAVAASKLITGKQIKKNTITAANIKKGSLTADTLSPAAKKSLTASAGAAGATGPAGPAGPAGAAGAPGPIGPTGPSDAFSKRVPTPAPITPLVVALQADVITLDVPAGSYVVSSQIGMTPSSDIRASCRVTSSTPSSSLSFASVTQSVPSAPDDSSIAIGGTVTLSEPGTLRTTCARPSSATITLRDAQITAIKVGSLTVQ